MREVALDYGYREIRTPIFEKTELFTRSVGEQSDIVTKEMYTFIDKSREKQSLTLRPEGTAPVVRAFVEHGLQGAGPCQKFFYMGPMFRYERPQSGRYRQFHQFGAEAIGISSPEQDVELIDLLYQIYKRLGLKNLNVMINSIGNSIARATYKERLCAFLQPHVEKLSEESKIRLRDNPLRILDSKSLEDQKLLQEAPELLNCLDEQSATYFTKVQELLTDLEIPFTINKKLVRGLDYYNQTVFEITSSELGAQNTIGAGGRYDGLIKTLGGSDLPSVGFATGIERVIQVMEGQGAYLPKSTVPKLFIASMGTEQYCFKLLFALRRGGIAAEMLMKQSKFKQQLNFANSCKATYLIVIGENEMQSGKAALKKMEDGEIVKEIVLAKIVEEMKSDGI